MLKFLICFFFLFAAPLMAQNAPAAAAANGAPAAQMTAPTLPEGESSKNPSMLTKLAVLAGLSLLPFAIMLLTSFMKIVVVLSLLRNALGVQQTPPNQV